MFVGAFLILSQRGYSDGDDAYFYQYTHEMGFFSYLSWRYETWVGRLGAEALVYLTFHLGLWFWRVVNAAMLILLPLGLLRLAGRVAGLKKETVAEDPGASITAVVGYFLMGAMTIGYAAVWVNGSIFYTWTFTCGIWALVPLADLVFAQEADRREFLYGMPCAVIATMSIEQMGAVLLTFEVLRVLYCLWKRRRCNTLMLIQTLLTAGAFAVLFAAPGNDIRVATEIVTWMPEYETMSLGQHLFITVQWLLSSFANENKLFLCGIWIAGILLLPVKRQKGAARTVMLALASAFTVAACLPFLGVTVLSDVGMEIGDITERIDCVPTASDLTFANKVALVWWAAALLFTLLLLWEVSEKRITMVLTYLAGIASEAIMFCSPTMYASGARVYYLTDLLYLFLVLVLAFEMKKERKRICYGAMAVLGIINFLTQIPLFLAQL